MKMETTVYVKGMRKRTENSGIAGMPNNLVTIEQCDKRRTVTLNDKRKLYYIAPFGAAGGEVIMEGEKRTAKAKPAAAPAKTTTQKGGVVTTYYNTTDTGERKKMYGLTARHVWTTMKMKPSPDACTKDSMLIKPKAGTWTCPSSTAPYATPPTPAAGAGHRCARTGTSRGRAAKANWVSPSSKNER